jgi:glutaredoxin-like YruB-family protein
MINVESLADFKTKTQSAGKFALLLYKSGSEQSGCAYENLKLASNDSNFSSVFAADVTNVRDIHTEYQVTSVPALLLFENSNYISLIKGCNERSYYKALIENSVFKAQNRTAGAKRVTVYSTPTCSWCNRLKSWLRSNQIAFSDIDISRDENAEQELVRRSGQQGVPQTDINGQIVVGFDQNKLKELLGIA